MTQKQLINLYILVYKHSLLTVPSAFSSLWVRTRSLDVGQTTGASEMERVLPSGFWHYGGAGMGLIMSQCPSFSWSTSRQSCCPIYFTASVFNFDFKFQTRCLICECCHRRGVDSLESCQWSGSWCALSSEVFKPGLIFCSFGKCTDCCPCRGQILYVCNYLGV